MKRRTAKGRARTIANGRGSRAEARARRIARATGQKCAADFDLADP